MALVAAAGGAFVGATFWGLVGWPAVPVRPAISLDPYLDPGWTNPLVRALAPVVASPHACAVLLALGAGALVLFCDAVARKSLLASKPGAAALASAAILVAPAWGVVLKLAGHDGILAGFPAAAAGLALVFSGARAAGWAGVVLVALAAALHPAWLAAAPFAVFGAADRRQAIAAAVLALGLPVAFAAAAPDAAAELAPRARLWFAARDLAAAPALAFSSWRRLDLPTGYEPLVGALPVLAGLAFHAIALGVGMMIGGIRQGLLAAGAAVLSVLGCALLVPGWVPGDRAFALVAVTGYVPLAALVLQTTPPRVARAVLPGLAIGVGVIAVMLANGRAPNWTRIGPALAIPGHKEFEREPDPARLVLYLNDVTIRDADARRVVDAADRLVARRAPALFPERLESILQRLTSRTPRQRAPEAAALIAEVTADLDLVHRIWRSGPRENFEAVAEALTRVHNKVLDLWFNWRSEPETIPALQRFQQLARDVIPVASRTGRYEYSIPLIQALQLIGPELPENAATVATQQILSGNVDEGLPALEDAVRKLPPRSSVTALAQGVVGVARLARGDPKAALADLQASWNVLGAGGVRNVSTKIAPDTLDYAMLAEILLARYEAATAIDPALAPQAARDLEELLKPMLSFGPRRVPPLAIMGRLQLALGNRDRALDLLREARRLPHASLDDRADGPIGRMAHPRYRRMALESLLAALGEGPDVAAERAEVESELARVRDK